MSQLLKQELKVIDLLTTKGWVSGSYIKEISENQRIQIVHWTPLGIERMRSLYSILKEVGFNDPSLSDLIALSSLCLSCVHEHGAGGSKPESID